MLKHLPTLVFSILSNLNVVLYISFNLFEKLIYFIIFDAL